MQVHGEFSASRAADNTISTNLCFHAVGDGTSFAEQAFRWDESEPRRERATENALP
jgi:hypothetical protein